MCITPTQPTTIPINPYISRQSNNHTISSDNRNNWLMCEDKWITYFLGNSLEDEVKQNSITPLLTHTHTHSKYTPSNRPQGWELSEPPLTLKNRLIRREQESWEAEHKSFEYQLRQNNTNTKPLLWRTRGDAIHSSSPVTERAGQQPPTIIFTHPQRL